MLETTLYVLRSAAPPPPYRLSCSIYSSMVLHCIYPDHNRYSAPQYKAKICIKISQKTIFNPVIPIKQEFVGMYVDPLLLPKSFLLPCCNEKAKRKCFCLPLQMPILTLKGLQLGGFWVKNSPNLSLLIKIIPRVRPG